MPDTDEVPGSSPPRPASPSRPAARVAPPQKRLRNSDARSAPPCGPVNTWSSGSPGVASSSASASTTNPRQDQPTCRRPAPLCAGPSREVWADAWRWVILDTRSIAWARGREWSTAPALGEPRMAYHLRGIVLPDDEERDLNAVASRTSRNGADRSSATRNVCAAILASVLLTQMAAAMLLSASGDAPTIDEPAHLAAGTAYVFRHDLRLTP